MQRLRQPRLLLGIGAATAFAAAVALGLSRPWEDSVIHAEPSKVDPGVTLVFDQKGIDQASEQASIVAGVPVVPPRAAALGLAVKAVRVEPSPEGRPANARVIRPVLALYFPEAVDPRALPKEPTELTMQITFLAGRVNPTTTEGEDDNAVYRTLAFDVTGFTVVRTTFKAAPDQGASYHLISDAASFMVRVGYEVGGSGKVRPSDEQMLPILRALALGER